MRKLHSTITAVLITLALPLPGADMPGVRGAVQARAGGDTNSNRLVRHPVLGYVAQPGTRELRAIVGVPGAAAISAPLALAESALRIHLAPGQTYALLERRDDDSAALPLDGTETGSPVPIPGALRAPDFVAFSPTGSAAIWYSSSDRRVQVMTGLPASPRVVRDIEGLTERYEAAAVSDNGASVLLLRSGGVDRLTPQGTPELLLSSGGLAAATFLPNRPDAVVADRGTGSVYLCGPASGVPPELAASGLSRIGEMLATEDGTGVWLALPTAHRLLRFDPRTRQLKTVELPVAPTTLSPTATRGVYLIASEPGQPAWILLDRDADSFAVFVPASQERGHGRGLKEVTNR